METRILIISSDVQSVKLVSEIVLKETFSLSVYDSLEKAARLAPFEDFEVIFVDMDLGIEKSMEYVSLVEDIKDHPFLVLLIGNLEPKQEAEVREKGIFIILEKPLDEQSIRKMLVSREWEQKQTFVDSAGGV